MCESENMLNLYFNYKLVEEIVLRGIMDRFNNFKIEL